MRQLVDDEIDLNSNFLSLVSQTKYQINVEIILDNNLENHKELHLVKENKRTLGDIYFESKSRAKVLEERRRMKMLRAELIYFIHVQSK